MKRVRRSSTDRVLLGVCGGLGEYFGIDGDLVRLIWILASLLGGVGIVPYIAAVLLFPEPGAPAGESRPRAVRNVGLVLAGVGGWLLLRQFGFEPLGAGALFWQWGSLLPFVLLVVGIVLLWPQTREILSPGGGIRRSVSNRVLAGVCGGLAERAGLDANLFRLGFVAAAVMSTGLAILAYVLLIFVLPEEEVIAQSPVAPAPPAAPPPVAPEPASAAPAEEPAGEPAEEAAEEPAGSGPAPTEEPPPRQAPPENGR